MKPSKELLRRVLAKTITPTELIAELHAQAPRSALKDRSHPWWAVEADEFLGVVALVSKGNAYLSVSDAVREAIRLRGKVVIQMVSGTVVYQVLSVAQAEVVVTKKIVEQAMPTEFVDPVWDEDLPSLDTFRRLAERMYLVRLMGKHRFNVTAASVEAEVARQTLHVLLERHGLKRPASVLEGTTETTLDDESEPLKLAV